MLKTKERILKPAARIKPMWELTPEQAKKAERLKTEDGKPVDNPKSAKQMRLLTEPLYSSWTSPTHGKVFMAETDVGLFFDVDKSPLVPDMFLSLGIKQKLSLRRKGNRAYFFWDKGKPPEIVVELVSGQRGGEKRRKFDAYAALGIQYYAIFDPDRFLGDVVLGRYELINGHYQPLNGHWFEKIGLGLSLWEGEFERTRDIWVRWSNRDGVVIPTGKETAEGAIAEAEHANAEAKLAKTEMERLRELLKARGIDPDSTGKKTNGKH